MADADGQVKIVIDTNAKEATKGLDSVSKAFDNTGKSAKSVASVFSSLQKGVNDNTEALREMALGGGKNSKEFQKLAQQTREYKKAIDEANKAVEKATGVTEQQNSITSKLSGTVTKLAGAYLGIQGIRAIINYSNQAVEAFRTQDVAIQQLNQTLKNAGVYSYQYSQEIQKLASEIQIYSNYGDEAIIKAQAMGQAYIGNIKITKELTKATVDFAAATGMDLEQAFTLVGKSIGSQTNALGRYGVALNKNMTESQKMEAITRQLGQRYQGTAAQMANTSVQLKNALGDLSEQFGRNLDPAVRNTQSVLIRGAQALTTWLQKVRAMNAEIKSLNIGELEAKIAKNNEVIDRLSKQHTFKGQNNERMKQLRNENDLAQAQIDRLKKQEQIKENLSKQNYFKISDDYSDDSTKKAKDAYEKLQESVSKAKREIELAAIAHGTSSQQVQNAFIKYRELNGELTKINQLFDDEKKKTKDQKTAYELLNKQISDTKDQLYALYLSGQGGTPAFTALKNQLVQLQTTAQNANTAISSKVGIDWTNTANSIKSQLSSALLTPLQEGESMFTRFGNLAFNVIQSIGQQLLENLVIEPAVNRITTAFQSLASATPLQSVTQALTNTGQVAAQTATSMTTLATSQTAASAIMSSTSGVLASSAATYMSSAVAAKQLAAAITQAAISQAAYSAALAPIVGAFLAPVAATLTGAAIAAGNVMASAGGFLSKFANGGVFKNGNVQAFAKGGVVDKPTFFPMANGGTGLMGEAGAEAVMPLKRMSNGKLGVQADGQSGTVVNIYNQSQSQIETRKRDDNSYDIIVKRVNEALMNERTSSGFRAAYQREDRKGLQAV